MLTDPIEREIVSKLAIKYNISENDVKQIVTSVYQTLKKNVEEGNQVTFKIRRFGTIYFKRKDLIKDFSEIVQNGTNNT
jgi:nucleoid DNA-binding protein